MIHHKLSTGNVKFVKDLPEFKHLRNQQRYDSALTFKTNLLRYKSRCIMLSRQHTKMVLI